MTFTIEELKAICEKATKAPWRVEPSRDELEDEDFYGDDELGISMGGRLSNGVCYRTIERMDIYSGIYPEDSEYEEAFANLEFIATARTALPELIAEVERLREENARLESQHAQMHAEIKSLTEELHAVSSDLLSAQRMIP